jgi:hypothetical protein
VTAPTKTTSTGPPASTCMERAVAAIRQTEDVPDHLLAHLSPLGWEHVNLTGDYVWGAQSGASENNDGLRPLRSPPEAYARAA